MNAKWAAHGHTAAEIIYSRANAEKTNMGLTSWSGKKPRKTDAEIAKNYLNKEELKVLNLIVSLYLDFAELQALSRIPMYMKDWIAKLDNFLQMASRDILSHAGKISHEEALEAVAKLPAPRKSPFWRQFPPRLLTNPLRGCLVSSARASSLALGTCAKIIDFLGGGSFATASLDKARVEYSKYQQQALNAPSQVEQHFLETIKEFEKAALIRSP